MSRLMNVIILKNCGKPHNSVLTAKTSYTTYRKKQSFSVSEISDAKASKTIQSPELELNSD